MRTRDRTSRSREGAAGASLIDWREPERNARVLDWRERAHTLGLVPVERTDRLEQVVEPPERLLSEEEPEAFDDQPEIGRRLAVTRERVRQIEAKAFRKIRAARHDAA